MQATESEVKSAIFEIEGMNCDVCATTIKSPLEKEAGVEMASVSFGDGRARPRSIDEERIVAVIQKPGFCVVGRDQTTPARADIAEKRSGDSREDVR